MACRSSSVIIIVQQCNLVQFALTQAKLAVTDAVAAAALDKRLCTMEEQLHSAHGEAADANGCARGAQQRIAAAEWRIEKVTISSAAPVLLFTPVGTARVIFAVADKARLSILNPRKTSDARMSSKLQD